MAAFSFGSRVINHMAWMAQEIGGKTFVSIIVQGFYYRSENL